MSDWLVTRNVSTPDVLGDIERYCGIALQPEEFQALESTTREKLILLAERLEFVHHLLVLRNVISQNTKVKKISVNPVADNGEFAKIQLHRSCVLWEHDFAGADFDIEAIIFYLLLTCIDTIKGQPEFVDAFDWLCNSLNVRLIANQDPESLQEQLTHLQETYRANFGITRRFIEAFVDDLSDDLKRELVANFMVAKVRDGEIITESMRAWNRRDVESKLKKLAGKLFSIRSSFTHMSWRTFLPVQPLETVHELTGGQLLCKSDVNLLNLLLQVVQCLIETQLIGANHQNSN